MDHVILCSLSVLVEAWSVIRVLILVIVLIFKLLENLQMILSTSSSIVRTEREHGPNQSILLEFLWSLVVFRVDIALSS